MINNMSRKESIKKYMTPLKKVYTLFESVRVLK